MLTRCSKQAECCPVISDHHVVRNYKLVTVREKEKKRKEKRRGKEKKRQENEGKERKREID